MKDIATGEQLLAQPIKVSTRPSNTEMDADGVMVIMKWRGMGCQDVAWPKRFMCV